MLHRARDTPTQRAASLGKHFNFPVHPVHDPECAFIGMVVIAGDGPVLTFSQPALAACSSKPVAAAANPPIASSATSHALWTAAK